MDDAARSAKTPPDESAAKRVGEEEDEWQQRAVRGRRFRTLLIAATGVTAALTLVLFAVFYWLDLSGAPYWAVGVSVIGGVVMRRLLFARPTVLQTLLFTAVTIAGALAGLALANILLS